MPGDGTVLGDLGVCGAAQFLLVSLSGAAPASYSYANEPLTESVVQGRRHPYRCMAQLIGLVLWGEVEGTGDMPRHPACTTGRVTGPFSYRCPSSLSCSHCLVSVTVCPCHTQPHGAPQALTVSGPRGCQIVLEAPQSSSSTCGRELTTSALQQGGVAVASVQQGAGGLGVSAPWGVLPGLRASAGAGLKFPPRLLAGVPQLSNF